MTYPHSVIIIPGLGDKTDMLAFAVRHWQSQYGLTPIFHPMGWRDRSTDFAAKFNQLLAYIDTRATNGDRVSVIGTSAGGSAAINALLARPDAVRKAINVCGRLRVGPTTGFRSFARKTSTSPAFAESVRLLESQEGSIPDEICRRVMTIRARFGDELVPASTTTFPGAHNIILPTIEHGLSICLAMGIFSDPLRTFLMQDTR